MCGGRLDQEWFYMSLPHRETTSCWYDWYLWYWVKRISMRTEMWRSNLWKDAADIRIENVSGEVRNLTVNPFVRSVIDIIDFLVYLLGRSDLPAKPLWWWWNWSVSCYGWCDCDRLFLFRSLFSRFHVYSNGSALIDFLVNLWVSLNPQSCSDADPFSLTDITLISWSLFT